mmetsp:Transcript_32822/g.63315  ORF Transcript_32822/g.63315 Transcript_32822/m.63315 type:complete len:336 (+) Transcript_32822:712-1719(+)
MAHIIHAGEGLFSSLAIRVFPVQISFVSKRGTNFGGPLFSAEHGRRYIAPAHLALVHIQCFELVSIGELVPLSDVINVCRNSIKSVLVRPRGLSAIVHDALEVVVGPSTERIGSALRVRAHVSSIPRHVFSVPIIRDPVPVDDEVGSFPLEGLGGVRALLRVREAQNVPDLVYHIPQPRLVAAPSHVHVDAAALPMPQRGDVTAVLVKVAHNDTLAVREVTLRGDLVELHARNGVPVAGSFPPGVFPCVVGSIQKSVLDVGNVLPNPRAWGGGHGLLLVLVLPVSILPHHRPIESFDLPFVEPELVRSAPHQAAEWIRGNRVDDGVIYLPRSIRI